MDLKRFGATHEAIQPDLYAQSHSIYTLLKETMACPLHHRRTQPLTKSIFLVLGQCCCTLPTAIVAVMGNTASVSKEAVVNLAKNKVSFLPPLGAPNASNPKVFFDIALGRYGDAVPLGRIVMEVKADVVPKTAENFLQLCTSTQPGFGYKNSRFHRVIPNFMCQVGLLGHILWGFHQTLSYLSNCRHAIHD